jgi:tRNA-specific 2-thiouridylase
LWFHTIGQRKGLGLSQGPWFVVKKDMAANILYISHGYDPIAQYGSEVKLGDFKFINEKTDRDYSLPQRVKFKIRHSPEFLSGTMQLQDRHMIINSDEPIAGIAPGQFGVVYDQGENICLGAGVIDNDF